MTADNVKSLLRAYRFRLSNEAVMQADVAKVLGAFYPNVEREAVLSKTCRIDFKIGRIGIEVKANRANARDTQAQLARYADTGALDEILLVTARAMVINDIGLPLTVYEAGKAWM